ncbi:MAG: HEPN domain-containing protein [Candidatus Eremiobacteraeota bacterium]|nr:HEPN domain-containing protein [Candidatus Eremiobacteraeota bacterium]
MRNAAEDLTIACKLAADHPARATFHAQQAAEMALKGVLIAHSDDHPLTHSVGTLLRNLRDEGFDVPAELAADAAALDLYYLGSRYPDAVGDADPAEVVPRADAERACGRAERVISFSTSSIEAALAEHQREAKDAPTEP